MSDEKNNRQTLIPLHSPPFQPPPYEMLDAKLLMVEYETDEAEIARITPAPFKPAGGNRLLAFVADCSQLSHSLFYHEAAVLQKVDYQGRSAVTVPYIWTSTDNALLAGRELYGMPKLLCDDGRLDVNVNDVSGKLSRGGREMMDLSINLQRRGTIDDLPFGPDWAFVRHIPSPDPDVPAIQQLVWLQLEQFAVKELWLGKGYARFTWPSSSLLDRIKPQRITGAWYGRFSWFLGGSAKILDQWEV